MANSYTTYYHIAKQEDHSDKFSMFIITDDMDIIDAALHGIQEQINAGAGSFDSLAARLADIESRLEALEGV